MTFRGRGQRGGDLANANLNGSGGGAGRSMSPEKLGARISEPAAILWLVGSHDRASGRGVKQPQGEKKKLSVEMGTFPKKRIYF